MPVRPLREPCTFLHVALPQAITGCNWLRAQVMAHLEPARRFLGRLFTV